MKRALITGILLLCLASLIAADLNWFSQGDERWKQERLGKSRRSTIGRSGCVLSCLAMLLNAEATNARITPGELNDWLRKNGGYYGSNMRWEIPGQIDGSGKGMELVAEINRSNKWEWLKDQLQQGNKVIVKVKKRRSHWVLVTRMDGPYNKASSYSINDPALKNYEDRTLAYYGGFKAARSYSGIWLDEASFSMDSDIQVVPIDSAEAFLFDIQQLDHPADAFVTVKNNLTVPISGFFLLGLFDENQQFMQVLDYEYAQIDSSASHDLIYQIENIDDYEKNYYSVQIIYSKYFSNLPSLHDTLPLAKNKDAPYIEDNSIIDRLIESLLKRR